MGIIWSSFFDDDEDTTSVPTTIPRTTSPSTTVASTTSTSTAAQTTSTSTAAQTTSTSTAAQTTSTSTAAPTTSSSTAAPTTSTSTAAPTTSTSTAAPTTSTSTAAPKRTRTIQKNGAPYEIDIDPPFQCGPRYGFKLCPENLKCANHGICLDSSSISQRDASLARFDNEGKTEEIVVRDGKEYVIDVSSPYNCGPDFNDTYCPEGYFCNNAGYCYRNKPDSSSNSKYDNAGIVAQTESSPGLTPEQEKAYNDFVIKQYEPYENAKIPQGDIKIHHKKSMNCLGYTSENKLGYKETSICSKNNTAELFSIEQTGTVHVIKNKHTDECMGIKDDKVHLHSNYCTDLDGKWKIRKSKNGNDTLIIHDKTSKCLTKDFTLNTCDDKDSMKYTLVKDVIDVKDRQFDTFHVTPYYRNGSIVRGAYTLTLEKGEQLSARYDWRDWNDILRLKLNNEVIVCVVSPRIYIMMDIYVIKDGILQTEKRKCFPIIACTWDTFHTLTSIKDNGGYEVFKEISICRLYTDIYKSGVSDELMKYGTHLYSVVPPAPIFLNTDGQYCVLVHEYQLDHVKN